MFIEINGLLINVNEILTISKDKRNTTIAFIKRAGQGEISGASWELPLYAYEEIKTKLTQLGIEIY